tara:strand:- start:50 stop:394 length:345 start_codon:yes stop_codon:yes gene_type:complete
MRIPEDVSLPITDLSVEDMDEHFNFYWENETEQGNIPLNYGEYVREYKDDLILMANQREEMDEDAYSCDECKKLFHMKSLVVQAHDDGRPMEGFMCRPCHKASGKKLWWFGYKP